MLRRFVQCARGPFARAVSLSFSALILYSPGREADLKELALLVRLAVELAAYAARELDRDLRAFDRLAFIVLHDAFDEAGGLGCGRPRHRERREKG